MLAAGLNAPPRTALGARSTRRRARARPRPVSRYEGQVALALDTAAERGGAAPYPFDVDAAAPVDELDLRPLWRALVDGRRRRRRAGAGLGPLPRRRSRAAAASSCGAPRGRTGRLPVVLTGGCFQNARLAEGILGELAGVL